MASKQIDWNDGTGGKIQLSYSASTGDQVISVSSDANPVYLERKKTVTFQTTSGTPSLTATLTIKQSGKDVILPTGYTRLQYIYNTNNAYINTGVLVDSNDVIDTQWIELASTSGDRMLCGVRPSLFSVNMYYGTADLYTAWGASAGFRVKTPDRRLRVDKGIFYGYTNGIVSYRNDKTQYTFASTKPIYVFCWNNGNNAPQYPIKQIGIKYFTITGKWDGIPCTDPNGDAGMFDTISNTFFKSPNNTPFIAGPIFQ